jgi:hypothetical protein
MQIWKLSATTPSDPRWSTQDYTGAFIIRAEGEYEARQLAQMNTIQFHSVDDRDRFQFSPWIDSQITTSEIVTDSGFMADGPPMVLSPTPDSYR